MQFSARTHHTTIARLSRATRSRHALLLLRVHRSIYVTQSSSSKNALLVYGLTTPPLFCSTSNYLLIPWYYYIFFKYIGSVEILLEHTSPLRILPTKTKREVCDGGVGADHHTFSLLPISFMRRPPPAARATPCTAPAWAPRHTPRGGGSPRRTR